jgi:hypothetical protein
MAQITSVTSEALQATLRRLLPSQQGFGEDLQASNVIMPIIDLTPTAEGSVLGINLQTAIAFGSITSINSNNSTVTLANVGGFYRVFGNMSALTSASVRATVDFDISDGISTKEIMSMDVTNTLSTANLISNNVDFVFYLNSGDSASVTTTQNAIFAGSVRQIADISGNLVNPSGFVSE